MNKILFPAQRPLVRGIAGSVRDDAYHIERVMKQLSNGRSQASSIAP